MVGVWVSGCMWVESRSSVFTAFSQLMATGSVARRAMLDVRQGHLCGVGRSSRRMVREWVICDAQVAVARDGDAGGEGGATDVRLCRVNLRRGSVHASDGRPQVHAAGSGDPFMRINSMPGSIARSCWRTTGQPGPAEGP